VNERVPRCTVADPALREAVGAYLLGALEPAESDRVAAHLAECSACRAEYGELIELLPLLATVSEGEAVNGPVRPEPAVLGRVLETTAQHRPGHAATRHNGPHRPVRAVPRMRLAIAAACLLLAGVGTGVGVMMSANAGKASTTQTVAGSWSAVATARPAYPGGGVISASVQVTPASWGSKIQLHMSDVPDGYTCTMVVVDSAGRQQPAGNWSAKDEGPFTVSGSVSLAPQLISSIQVELPDGSTLLSLNHPR
jgi:anti-sigma factor RsiW